MSHLQLSAEIPALSAPQPSTLSPPQPPPPLAPPIIRVQKVAKTVHVNENSHVIFKLTQAIEEDSLTKIASMIEDQGVNVNSTLSFGVCILLKAIRSRSRKIVEYLIDKGADPELSVRDMMKRPDGLEVEYSSCKRNDQWNADVLKKLLPRLKERLHSIVDNEGRTLLHLACYFPDLSFFEYLLRFGLDPNVTDNKGCSVLSLLISHQDSRASFEMAQLVLDLPNTEVDIRNHIGSTPLYQSFLMNRLEFFYLLLQKGADPFMRTHNGSTLMHCPFLHCHKYILLYDLGLDVNSKNNLGMRPLQNKTELSFDFFILIILGRDVLDEEYSKMEKCLEPRIVKKIREKVERGDFAGNRLQALCRQKIRRLLFQKDHAFVTESVWLLPLPKPLRLYLDVILYAQHLLEALSC